MVEICIEIYYIKKNYMFRHLTMAIFRLRTKKTKQLYSNYVGCIQWDGKR